MVEATRAYLLPVLASSPLRAPGFRHKAALAGLDGPSHRVHTIVGGYSANSYGAEVEYYF